MENMICPRCIETGEYLRSEFPKNFTILSQNYVTIHLADRCIFEALETFYKKICFYLIDKE